MHGPSYVPGDDLFPALVGDRFGLGLTLRMSRLRRRLRLWRYRLGRYTIASERGKDSIAAGSNRRAIGWWGNRRLRSHTGRGLYHIVRMALGHRRWHRLCVFRLRGFLVE
jgi:hypothetical protein